MSSSRADAQTFVVGETAAGERLDRWLASLPGAPTRSQIAAAIQQNDLQGARETALRLRELFGPDNFFTHMTGMSDFAWQRARDAGVAVSLAVPIEMNMRHGMPPMLKMQSLKMEPSLSSDVATFGRRIE